MSRPSPAQRSRRSHRATVAVCLTVLATFAAPTLSLPGRAWADPPLDSWDRGDNKAPPVPSAPPPPPPSSGGAGPDLGPADRPTRRRPVIRRRRQRVDLSSLRARDYGDKIVIGLFSGGRFYSSNAQLGNSNDRDLELSSGLMFGLRTGYNITRYISIQGEGLYQPSSYSEDGGTAHVLGLRGFLMLHLPWRQWRPFLLVGGGVEMLPHEVDGVTQDYDGAFIGGLGAKYDMSHTVSLRFDVRGLSTDGKINGTINWEAHVGLTFRFMVQ